MNGAIVFGLWVLGVGGLLADVFAGSLILGVIALVALVASVGAALAVYGPLEATGLGAGSAAIAAGILRFATTRFRFERGAPQALPGGVKAAEQDERAALLGQRGVAVTVLRPSGFATLAGKRVDVVTQGEHVDAGASLEVIAVDGARVVVVKR